MKIQKISVVVPIYNEADNLPDLIDRIKKVLIKTKKEFEIIFVDDNSTDASNKIFQTRNRDKSIKLYKKIGKKGKAFSLTEGFEHASGDAIVMIDADLQYPPEVIPEMVTELENADIVVANRKNYKDNFHRKMLSKIFRFGFGKLLFGLDHDIQSGLKVFSSDVIKTVKFMPSSAWTFDLEMLHIARYAGYKIKNFDISFEKRNKGQSSINIFNTTLDIGINALRLKFKKIHPLAVLPENTNNMLGAGIRHKKKLFVTHTTLPHHVSAYRTFTFLQKFIIAASLITIFLGLTQNAKLTLQILVASLSFIYFVDVLFNLFLILKSLSFPSEIVSTEKELAEMEDKDLPIYSILCPLYKEAHMIPQFMDAINNLSYPKDKLDVILLLEEDDLESQETVVDMQLPQFVRTVVVPHSIPKTKPKACNYGLAFAKGEYLVIFDAEDIPEPMQLKKAILGFKKVPSNTICLQAKLNYYNPHQNLLTRFFTAEYSLWFDVTLTGLQSINTSIPLGGTSNHFRIESLRKVEGWDPFNVTEDADLGIRLFKRGYKTAIIDSITLEEANSKYGNWLRQRSRWIKGYMQTYLVHMREVLSFTKKQGIHSLIFQLVVGGKIAFVLINPILWIATFSYFALYSLVGPQIESLYPSVVFYMAVISLIFGNFLFLYYYMIGVAKKGQWNLMKFVFLIPFYWIMISVAALVALYQLIFKPHYWEKTVHGFHLDANKKIEAISEKIEEEVVDITSRRWNFSPFSLKTKLSSKINTKKHYFGGVFYVGALGVASIFNFGFSTFMGRTLDLEDFALISLISGLLSITSVIASALGSATTFKTGYLIGRYNESTAFHFWKLIRRKSISVSVILVAVWIALLPTLSAYFKTSNILPFVFFSPIIFSLLAYSTDRGFLSSRLSFVKLGSLAILEAVLKLGIALVLVFTGLKVWTYTAIPASIIVTFILGWLFVLHGKKRNTEIHEEAKSFPKKFFFASLVSGLSAVILLNLDVVLAKHYLNSKDAGIYALASLIVKMIYFAGTFIAPFTIPLVSRNEGASKDSNHILRLTLLGTFLLTFPGLIVFGIFGKYSVPLIFGEKAHAIIPYLLPMSAGIIFYSLARVICDYYLAKKYYIFSAVAFLIGVIAILLIDLFHSNSFSFVAIMSFIWILYFIVIFILHIFAKEVKIIEDNLIDLGGLFKQFKKTEPKNKKLRILIFNWRDTKHKWAGGAEVYIQELGKRWVKDGNVVTIFCGNDSTKPRNEIIDGIQVVRHGGFYTVYVWAFLYYMFKFRGKYDIIIDCENGIPFFTPLYARIPKFLLIHHVHQEVFRKSLKKPWSSLALFLEAKFMPQVYRNIQVITVSPSSRDEILRHQLTKKEPLIIYNGVDLSKFIPGEKNKKPMILYLGRLQYYKSLHVFLIAAAKILRKIPDAQFIIAGEGEEKENLILLAKQLRIVKKIKFVGRVSEEKKIALFQKAWVFVNPSFMEGWGITTIEAAASGTPTVASNVPGLKDAVRNDETGFLVRYGQYSGFVNSILKIINDESLRHKISSASVNWSKNFGWEEGATKFYEALSNEVEKNQTLKTSKFTYIFSKFISLL